MVSEISILIQVRILFSQSSLKMNSDLVFTHFWSGFSFFFIHSKSWSLFRSVIFDAISHNGKSICEGRAKFNWKFNFDRTKQIAFSDYQITKKSNMKSKLRLNASGFSIRYSTPPFANTLLAAGLF